MAGMCLKQKKNDGHLCDSYSAYVLTPRAAGRLIPCMSHVCMREEHRVYVLRFGVFSGARIVSNVL